MDSKDSYTAKKIAPQFVRAGNDFESEQTPETPERQQRDDISMGQSSMDQSRVNSTTPDTRHDNNSWNNHPSPMLSTLSPLDRTSPASASQRSGNKCVSVQGNSTPSPHYHNRPLHHIVTTTKQPRMIDSLRDTFISAAMQPVTRLLKVSIPSINDDYDGAATRTRSVKSAKRKPKTQD